MGHLLGGHRRRPGAAALGGQPLPADALALLFDPAYAAKLSGCGIAMMISPSQVVVQALIYLGKEPALNRPEDLPAVAGLLRAARPHVRVFTSAPINDLVNGEVCVAMIYSGDAYIAARRASEAKSPRKIRYLLSSKGRSCGWTPSPSPGRAASGQCASLHRFHDEAGSDGGDQQRAVLPQCRAGDAAAAGARADGGPQPLSGRGDDGQAAQPGRVPPALQRERVRLFNQFKNNSYR